MATIKPIDRLTIYVEYTLGHVNAPTPVGNRDAWWDAFFQKEKALSNKN